MCGIAQARSEKNPTRWWLRVAMASCLAAASMLSGCAISPISPEERAKDAPSSLQLTPGQGLVALKVTSNRASISTFFTKWGRLRVKNLATSDKTWLSDRADYNASHSLFVDALPAGTYEVDQIESWTSAAATLTSSADASGALPTFVVAAGQLTDLGTLAFIRKHYPVNSSEFRWGIAPESPSDREKIIRQLAPKLSTLVGRQPVLGWSDNDRLRTRRAAYDDSLGLSMRMASPVAQADGSTLFGESFGRIAIRSAQGIWSSVQAPTALPIRALHVGPTGELYAGSDNGVLLVRRSAAETWELVPLPVNDASVIYLGPLPGTSEVLVVLQTNDQFVGLSLNASAKQPFKEQFSKPRELFFNPSIDTKGVVLQFNDKVLFMTEGLMSKVDVLRYSSADRNWRTVPVTDDSIPSSWVSLGNSGIGRFAGIPLTGIHFAVSNDDGKSWERRGDLNWANGALLFVSDTVGYVIRLDSMAAFNPENTEQSVWKTSDAGRTWSRAGSPKVIGGKLVGLGSTEKIGYVGLNGRFLVSQDGGKTWQVERVVP